MSQVSDNTTVPFLSSYVFNRFPDLKPLRKIQGLTCSQLQEQYGITTAQCSNLIDNISTLSTNSTTLKQDTVSAVTNLLTMYNMLSGSETQISIKSADNTHQNISSELSADLQNYQQTNSTLQNINDIASQTQGNLKRYIQNINEQQGNIRKMYEDKKDGITTQKRVVQIDMSRDTYNSNVIKILYNYVYIFILGVFLYFLSLGKVISVKTFVFSFLLINIIFIVIAYYKINALNIRVSSSSAIQEIEDWARGIAHDVYKEEQRWIAQYRDKNCVCPSDI